MIYYIDENKPNSCYKRQLPNGKFRYEGYIHNIRYCVDSKTDRTEQDVKDILDGCSVDYLIDNEKYIINLK